MTIDKINFRYTGNVKNNDTQKVAFSAACMKYAIPEDRREMQDRVDIRKPQGKEEKEKFDIKKWLADKASPKVVKYGIPRPEKPEVPVAKYAIPAEPKNDLPVAKYAIPGAF